MERLVFLQGFLRPDEMGKDIIPLSQAFHLGEGFRGPDGGVFDSVKVKFFPVESKILFVPAHLQDIAVGLVGLLYQLGTFADPFRIDVQDLSHHCR